MTEATFTAHRLEDALALVKRALGAEALILSSRRIGTEDEPPRFEVRASLVDASAPPEPVRVQERVVTVAERGETEVLIERGVAAGERVATDNLTRLGDGVQVAEQ